MLSASRQAIRSAGRGLVAWLLALVLSIQGMAADMWAVQGPSHVHQPPERPVVLVDFRRDLPEGRAQHGGLLAWLGHAIGHASAQRHHHAPSDISVVRAAQEPPADAINVDTSSSGGGSSAAFIALIPTQSAWEAGRFVQPQAFRPLWAPTTRYIDRLERPPRSPST